MSRDISGRRGFGRDGKVGGNGLGRLGGRGRLRVDGLLSLIRRFLLMGRWRGVGCIFRSDRGFGEVVEGRVRGKMEVRSVFRAEMVLGFVRRVDWVMMEW